MQAVTERLQLTAVKIQANLDFLPRLDKLRGVIVFGEIVLGCKNPASDDLVMPTAQAAKQAMLVEMARNCVSPPKRW